MKFNWREDIDRGYPRHSSMIRDFRVTIVSGGACTLGVNVFVGTFAGEVVAISKTFADAEKAIIRAAGIDCIQAIKELDQC